MFRVDRHLRDLQSRVGIMGRGAAQLRNDPARVSVASGAWSAGGCKSAFAEANGAGRSVGVSGWHRIIHRKRCDVVRSLA